ncbi:Sulfotransferase domain protein [Actinomadura rubteroloni]|uniref:Sulfotransferase domain protein n=1 Tax=Actinomadura rubteroloni TaxID=1926885 RepID=A0A2P4UPZ7_9ACTN|nr:sulfotransferase [Actinomadura rubteroloni]POM27127.1 Sulfotransferase domain protein [Actinomadura rubteroloni]
MADSSALVRPAKQTVRKGLRAVGRLTHEARMVPDFLIVGAQRCGTTSLFRYLREHPGVLRDRFDKGVHYFDMSYQRGFAWYRGHFPLTATARLSERRTGIRPQTFEASPFYLFHPLAPERIARDLPDAKLIVMVRDPVERAYSAHAQEVRRGFETEPFDRALELEDERLRGEIERMVEDPAYVSFAVQHHAYRARGRYAEQLERLEGLVGRERIHVVDNHELATSPETVYDGVLDFLGLPRTGYPVFERHNSAPRAAAFPDALRRELDDHFAPEDERLTRWLGKAPSWR